MTNQFAVPPMASSVAQGSCEASHRLNVAGIDASREETLRLGLTHNV